MRVLAIETSCDETAAAVVEAVGSGQSAVGATVRVLSSVVASQANLHARTAGVVPEVAARAHVEAVNFVVDDALRASGMWSPNSGTIYGSGKPRFNLGSFQQGRAPEIDAVAVTTEPGLRPALVIGEAAGRALAAAWNKPFVPVNHLAGHIAAGWLPLETGLLAGAAHRQEFGGPENTETVGGLLPSGDRLRQAGNLKRETSERFAEHRSPAVALVVSGGHTQLWKIQARESATINGSTFNNSSTPLTMKEWDVIGEGLFQLTLLGQTRDDAAGEAFDKIARLLGLPYPGGAALADLGKTGDACEFSFPRPMINSGDLNFSFSGLKTAVYYLVRELTPHQAPRADAGQAPDSSPDFAVSRRHPTSPSLRQGFGWQARLRGTRGYGRQEATPGRQLTGSTRADLAASAQEAIVDVLVSKTVEAAAREGAAEVILTGGVAANQRLRQRLREALGGLPLIVPDPQYCTDNAAMIGAAAVLGIAM